MGSLDALNEDRVERALSTLAETDLQHAECKARVLRSDQKVKAAKALVFAALSGGVEERKQALEAHPDVQAAYEAHFQAVTDFEVIKARREREFVIVDLFRTLESSRRQGQIR